MRRHCLFYERLLELVEKSGKSMNCVERELGYSRNALNNYKNGSEPSGSRLLEIAEYFRVDPDYLVGKLEKTDSFHIDQFFNHLSYEQKYQMLKVSQEWWSKKLTTL